MANFGKQNLMDTLGYAGTGAKIGSVVPGIGTALGAGIGAGYGFFKGLFGKKPFNVEDYTKANAAGGYVTVPKGGIPGHPEWEPGTRQWIPPGSPIPDQNGNFSAAMNATGTTGTANPDLQVNENAIRERAIAPTRGLFQAGMRNVERNKALQGGYAPGYGAQMLALARGQSQAASDAALSAENSINQQKLGLAQFGLDQTRTMADIAARNRGLDIQEKSAPSALDKGLNTANNLMGTIGKGAAIGSNIWDWYKKAGNSGVSGVGDLAGVWP